MPEATANMQTTPRKQQTASTAHYAHTASKQGAVSCAHQVVQLNPSCVVVQRSVPFLSLLDGGDEEVDQDPEYTNWWLDHGARYEQINGTVRWLDSHCYSRHMLYLESWSSQQVI